MKIPIKNLKPGVEVRLIGSSAIVRLSTLPGCPDCGKPNFNEVHGYAYFKWYNNYVLSFGNGDPNAEVEIVP